MPKLRLTDDSIKRLKPPTNKAKVQYFDSLLTGFMCEVKNTGTKPTTTATEKTTPKR